MIPSSNADTIIHYNSPVYSGQFSDDGNFFFACVKDYKVRMYGKFVWPSYMKVLETKIFKIRAIHIGGDIIKQLNIRLDSGL